MWFSVTPLPELTDRSALLFPERIIMSKKIKGNTVTVTFKNIKSGTYYIGLHAWNRTSEDNSKNIQRMVKCQKRLK